MPSKTWRYQPPTKKLQQDLARAEQGLAQLRKRGVRDARSKRLLQVAKDEVRKLRAALAKARK